MAILPVKNGAAGDAQGPNSDERAFTLSRPYSFVKDCIHA
jgi:hypothetical protein